MPPGPGHFFIKPRFRFGFLWGKRHMIDFLMDLSDIWGYIEPNHPFGIYDISKEGGGSIGHRSHRKGIDVDIYVIRQDGKEAWTHYKKPDEYDRERTIELAKLVYDTAGPHMIDKFYFDDQKVIDAVPGVAKAPNAPKEHGDHFHIRLKDLGVRLVK